MPAMKSASAKRRSARRKAGGHCNKGVSLTTGKCLKNRRSSAKRGSAKRGSAKRGSAKRRLRGGSAKRKKKTASAKRRSARRKAGNSCNKGVSRSTGKCLKNKRRR
jgi:hypothetical protein